MKRLNLIILMLCGFGLGLQPMDAQENTTTLFYESFDLNNGTGGYSKTEGDNPYSGNIATSKPLYDNDGWIGTKDENSIYGANKCIKFGKGSNVNGVCTTPEIDVVSRSNIVKLTFKAAGWATGTNKLTVKVRGATISGQADITLDNAQWNTYTAYIFPSASFVQLTFTGWRGFLDDVLITENVVHVPAPSLTDNFLFWANTTEAPTSETTIIPSALTTAYYTTDGSEPVEGENKPAATLTSKIKLNGTTTVKAVAYVGSAKSEMVEKTYTVGETVESIAAFAALPDGTEQRLFLSAGIMARVLSVDGSRFVLRDNTGTLLVDFGDVSYCPTPQEEQHVAGWIVGRKQTVDGRPALVATGNTTPHYMAFAQPVTEEPTAVKNIQREQSDAKAEYYNLAGQRVAQPGKGIYITNGKKEVRK